MRQSVLLALGLSLLAPAQAAAPARGKADQAAHAAIAKAVADARRSATNRARDPYRHPAETLAFFGVQPNHRVVEIWPAGGWYAEILAPLTRDKGSYYGVDYWPEGLDRLRKLQQDDPARFGHAKLAAFPWSAGQPKVPDGSADVVLTFRNVHNWRMGYKGDGKDYSAEAFRQIYAMLKPGGTLGVVDHRLPESASAEREKTSGYVKVSTVRKLAEAAGFRFAGASEVNANPKDTADWEKGVWTLPPRFAMGDTDRAKYAAIGESDRMTLKFVKPK